MITDLTNPMTDGRFRFYCQKVLPLVYEDSLSYYEVLCKLSDKLADEIDRIDKAITDMKDYVDNAIAQIYSDWQKELQRILQSYLDSLNTVIAELRKETDDKLNDQKIWVEGQIADLTLELSRAVYNLTLMINNGDEETRRFVIAQIDQLRKEIPEITSVMVINPVDGQLVPIQKALDDMFTALRYQGLTAMEYDVMELTAERYDHYSMTAFEYDMYAKEILKGEDRRFYMFDPWTGLPSLIKNVVSMLAQLHRGPSPTAEEYDGFDWMAETFDAMGLTAYDYDWTFPIT